MLESGRLIELLYVLGKCEVMAGGRELYKTATKFMASTVMNYFSLGANASYPLCSQSRPRHLCVWRCRRLSDKGRRESGGNRALGVARPFRCHSYCRFRGYSNHSTLPGHVSGNTRPRFPSRKLRAFSNSTQMAARTAGRRMKK